MQNPPDLEVATLILATSASINNSKVDAAIAAPGARLRIRVWTCRLSLAQNLVSTERINGFLRPNGSATRLAIMAANSGQADEVTFPGGYRFPDNTGVDLETFASVVGNYRFSITYTIEAVS